MSSSLAPSVSRPRRKPAAPKRKRATRGAPPPPTDPHVAKALAYARGVVTGKIIACLYVRQACQRQLDDLKRFRRHPIYYWSEAHAGRVCRFIELLRHIKGPLAGERMKLEPWQCFILTTVFGWRRKDTGGRRYRRAYIELPRGNGKSAIASGVALYCLAADQEEGAEVYSAATEIKQARIVWDVARAMLDKDPVLVEKLGLRITPRVASPQNNVALSISQPATNGVFTPLSREAGTKDGANLHCGVIDELHAHKRRDMHDVLETAMSKRLASLLWMITTAGDDTGGICYEVRGVVVKILAKLAENESTFGVIYTLDEGDDAEEPLITGDLGVWQKANPNWGVSVQPDEFCNAAQKALQIVKGALRGNFLRKHLGVWTTAGVKYIPLAAWDRCADPKLDESQFGKDAECTIGLDLASKVDIAAKVKLFWRDLPKADGALERHYYCFPRFYLPEAAIDEGRHASYGSWADEGLIETTEGEVLDFAIVKDALRADAQANTVREVPYDPWQATQLAQEMLAEGIPMVEVRQIVAQFSEPMKELLALVLAGRLHHTGNRAMRWMIDNLVAKEDAKANVYPRKERPEEKIDGPVALIMALARATQRQAEPPSVYETRGIAFA